ncbi:3-ketoacyl-CoA thiolase, mitochondrial [Trichinella nativa]|uniref:3-ketoacyl-CoA thiolase, mitochondrial n=1 Tax=Trichinella nativa TaxID=6335 RepID=A0A0V1L481_9BILA|nr:3-ketoacyl-CoA thiolase, mitochondrial [Trichinella nativa]
MVQQILVHNHPFNKKLKLCQPTRLLLSSTKRPPHNPKRKFSLILVTSNAFYANTTFVCFTHLLGVQHLLTRQTCNYVFPLFAEFSDTCFFSPLKLKFFHNKNILTVFSAKLLLFFDLILLSQCARYLRRTAFGAYGGKLKNHTPIDMGEIVARAALEASGVSPNNVNSVIFGNCIHASDDAGYLARHVTLRMGLPIHVPAMSVNRLCGSGFQSIIDAAREIMVGDSNVVIAGGSESMSQATYAVRDVRFGTKFGAKLGLHDTLMETLTDTFVGAPMGMTAETIATKFGITRQQADEVALRSQTRWRLANNNGYFKQEIVPVKVKTKKGEENFEVDEHPRETSMEILGKLPSAFKKGGIVTAGNASGICDGASAVIVASEKAVKDYHLTPLVKIIGWNVSGCDPSIMGIGPVPAVKGLMEKVQMNLKDMDLVEVNEAFASQCAVVERELKLDPDKTNVNGGAIALGHPLATSGNRIVVHLMHELRRRNLKYGLGSACIGGGQGIAMILENIPYE